MEYDVFDLSSAIPKRADRPSYHIFSSDHLRSEIWNLDPLRGSVELTSEGEVLIVVWRGAIAVEIGEKRVELPAESEIHIRPHTSFSFTPSEASTIQLVWVPGFSDTAMRGGDT